MRDGNVVVFSRDLAAIVDRVIEERGGLQTEHAPGQGKKAGTPLDGIAHEMASISRGVLTEDSARRLLYRIRAGESQITDVGKADIVLLACGQPPHVLADLALIARGKLAAQQMAEAYALEVEEMSLAAQVMLAWRLWRFCAGLLIALNDPEWTVAA